MQKMKGAFIVFFCVLGIVSAADIDVDVCRDKPDGYFTNNPVNCQAYWICLREIGYAGLCEPPYNFNENHQICDLPENSPCMICPPAGIHFFGINTSCTQYHFCFQGNHTVRECTNGLHFDIVHKTCDRPEIAKCEYRKCPTHDDANKLVTYASVERCEEYFICYEGHLMPYRCNDGIHWNQSIQQCDIQDYANCTISEPVITCPNDDEIHFISHPNDCQKYFVCAGKSPILRTCPIGLLFDPVLLECNTATEVKCK